MLLVATMVSVAGNLFADANQNSTLRQREVTQQAPTPNESGSPEWALVVVGIITFLVIGWQSWETRRSAQAVRDSIPLQRQAAEAAQKSADALIMSERAWVMVDIKWQQGAHIFEGTGNEGEHTGIYVDYLCLNQGKSFAQITEKGYVFKIVNVLPQEPDFRDMNVLHHTSEYVTPNSATVPYQLSGIFCNGHQKPDKLMVLYGRVKYNDVFGQHETRFGYMITGQGNLDRIPATSYPSYNNHA
jgi:hypothetical protein